MVALSVNVFHLKKPSSVAYVLDQWAIELKDVKMNKTRVEITDYGKAAGMWAAGADLIGKRKRKHRLLCI